MNRTRFTPCSQGVESARWFAWWILRLNEWNSLSQWIGLRENMGKSKPETMVFLYEIWGFR
jgi:hypothetical protein